MAVGNDVLAIGAGHKALLTGFLAEFLAEFFATKS